MGIFKKLTSAVLNIFTFGASGRIEKRVEAYKKTEEKRNQIANHYAQVNMDTHSQICYLTVRRKLSLNKIQTIERKYRQGLRALNNDKWHKARIEEFSLIELNLDIDDDKILADFIASIPFAASIGLTYAGTVFLISSAVGSKSLTIGALKISSIKLTTLSISIIKATVTTVGASLKAGATSVALAKGGLILGKVGAATMATKFSALGGPILFAAAIITSGAIISFSADSEIEKIDKAERELIREIDTLEDLRNKCCFLKERVEEISSGIDMILPTLKLRNREFRYYLFRCKIVKFFRLVLQLSPLSSTMHIKMEKRKILLEAELMELYKLITVKIPYEQTRV